jgi:hypothetical protein
MTLLNNIEIGWKGLEGQRPSLFCPSISDEEKFVTLATGANAIKHFMAVSSAFSKEARMFSLASLSSLV